MILVLSLFSGSFETPQLSSNTISNSSTYSTHNIVSYIVDSNK